MTNIDDVESQLPASNSCYSTAVMGASANPYRDIQ